MKLYVIVRSDIAPGLQIAQSGHALVAFQHEHAAVYEQWHRESNNLVCLAAASKEELAKLAYDLHNKAVPVALFREPDLGDELTAIAVGPAGGRALSNLPLALRRQAA
jgi:peptidyl-tRNA hydrolase